MRIARAVGWGLLGLAVFPVAIVVAGALGALEESSNIARWAKQERRRRATTNRTD